MAATDTVKTAKTGDATPTSFNMAFQDKDGSGASLASIVAVRDSAGNDINPAADGTDATGVTQLTGGVGIRGWLSGIYSKLSGTLAVSGTFWQATQPVSVASTVATSETYANLIVNAAGTLGAPISVSNSSATLLAAARAGRKEVTIIFESAVQARIGGSNVTGTAYGALYGGVAQEAITISGGAAVYGYGVGGTATVSVLEVY